MKKLIALSAIVVFLASCGAKKASLLNRKSLLFPATKISTMLSRKNLILMPLKSLLK